MNNVSVRVMTPEEILEKITEEKNLKLSVKLAKSLSENGVVVSVFEDNFGEVQVCNVCVDFSEHDKKVTEEKDEKIAKLETDLKECKDEVIAVRKNRDEMMEGFRNGIKPYVDLCQMHERIAELERENNSLKEKLSFIRTRVTEEARDFWDKDMFGSLVVTVPKKFSDEVKVSELKKELSKANDIYMDLRSRVTADAIEYFVEEKYDRLVITLPENMANAKRNIELEDRHQSDCIQINRLNVALEVMTEKYMKLKEVHGVG